MNLFKNKNHVHKITILRAFSLVEMLMALLVASLLLAALAPVITRKLSTDNIHITSTNNNLQEVEHIVKCFRANNEIKLEDIASSDNRATFLLVSGGGGGGGASGAFKTSEISFSTPSSSTSSSTSKVLNLNKDMIDFELETLIGGGGGGGGGSYTTEGNTEYCTQLGNGKTDTTGHTGSASSPIFVYSSGTKACVTAYDQQSSTECGIFTNTTGYNATVCSYTGAIAACNALTSSINTGKFVLPTRPQMEPWRGANGSGFLMKAPPDGADGNGYGRNASSPYYVGAHNDEVNKIAPRIGSFWSTTPNDDSAYGIANCVNALSLLVMHFYSNNGALTFEGGTNCAYGYKTGYKQYASTRCILFPYFSFSGGGGGGAAGIVNKNNFNNVVKNLFKKAIQDNLENGSVVIEAGKGGDKGAKGSNGSNGKNGGNGGESCISVYQGKNGSGGLVLKICAQGGNGGGGAVVSLNYKNSSSYYAAGGAVKPLNSCYYQNYMDGATGNKTSFNCSHEGALGEHGYGMNDAMEITWGHGGASPLNSNTFAGTTSLNGTTLNSITYAGAGGSGGRSRHESNDTYSTGDGGAGSGGFVKITYKNKKDGAAGGGGAGGTAVKIGNIILNKSYYDCKITVGQGGTGGIAGNTQNSGTAVNGDNGVAGGDSSITCDGGNTIYTVYGGKGGKGATGATSSSNALAGNGGAAFTLSTATGGKIEGLKQSMIYMVLGKAGQTPDSSNENAIKTGGNGGKSGTGAIGGCGGGIDGSNNADACITLSVSSPDGKGFKVDDVSDAYQFYGSNIITAWKSIVQSSTPAFGTAGAGGGGGTYKNIETIGKGGNGMPGYVCVFYTKAKD